MAGADLLLWRGDVASVAALVAQRAQGRAPALVLDLDPRTQRDVRTGVPDFVLEEQAACLGTTARAAVVDEVAIAAPRATDAAQTARALGLRAFVCACAPPAEPDVLGRFIDDVEPRSLAACETLVVDGRPFGRRLDALAGEPFAHDGGWRLDLGLRGC